MDIATNLLFLIVFGIAGFIIGKIWGFDPYTIVTDLLAVVLIIMFVAVMFPVLVDPSKSLDVIPAMVKLFSDNIVGILIADIAGVVIGAITN